MIESDDCGAIGGVPDGMGGCRIGNDFVDFALGDDACRKVLKGSLRELKGIKVCFISTLPSEKNYAGLKEAASLFKTEYGGVFAFGNFYRFAAMFKDYKLALRMDKKLGTHICTDEGVPGDLFEHTIQKHLDESHLFEIANGVKLLLSKTEPPNKNDMFRLPFGTVFLDVGFKKEEMEKFGIDIGYDEIIGIMITEGKMIRTPQGKFASTTIPEYDHAEEAGTALRMTIIGLNKDKSMQFDVFNRNVNLKDEYKDWKVHRDTPGMCNRNAQKFVHTFVINFLNFIYSPEVTFVEKEADAEKNKKRMREGKAPVPPRNFITLTGKVKKYAQDINDNPEKWHYSHRFYVMGHWRTLQNPRYGKNIGKRIWVDDFIKGDGVLIEKKYILDDSGTEID